MVNKIGIIEMHSVIKNGEIIKESEALLPALDPAVESNYSVYEALRVIGGKVVHLQDHIKRLNSSASIIGLEIPKVDWMGEIDKLIKADKIQDATMRIVVYGTREPLYFISWSTILCYPDFYYTEGVKAITYNGERFLPQCKTSNLLLNYLSRKEAEKRGAFEALLVNREKRILEGSRSNFYALKGSVIYTAPDNLVLDGVTRISVLRALKEMGIEVVFDAVLERDVYSFDAIFISSTSMGAMTLNSVNNREVKTNYSFVSSVCKKVREWEREDA